MEVNITRSNRNNETSYLKQIFQELLEKRNVLVVLAKGLGAQLIFVKLISLYCIREQPQIAQTNQTDKTSDSAAENTKNLQKQAKSKSKAKARAKPKSTEKNRPKLYIILNASSCSKSILDELLTDGVSVNDLPVNVTSSCTSVARNELYKQGGCFLVTSRILVVDLLTKNLDASVVDGMLVYNAHNVTEASSHAFALRMFRERQPKGFVKAITNAASSLAMGFGKLREVMTSCGVDQLSLWPRFHVTVKEFLSRSAPEVLELAQSLSPLAGCVQNKLVLLLELNLKELQRCANVDLSDLIFGKQGSGSALDVLLRRRLDKQWHTLSDKTKALISDVKTLQTLLANLLTFDPTTFHLLAENVKREATQFSAVPRSVWMLTKAADDLFSSIKKRVYNVVPMKTKHKPNKKRQRSSRNLWALGRDGIRYKLSLTQEEKPKWALLKDVLAEVDSLLKARNQPSPHPFGAETVVFCKDAETCREVREYLGDPKALQQQRFTRYLSKLFKRHKGLLLKAAMPSAQPQQRTKQDEDQAVQEAKRARHSKLSGKETSADLTAVDAAAAEKTLFEGETRQRLEHALQQNLPPLSALTVEHRLLLLHFLKLVREKQEVIVVDDDADPSSGSTSAKIRRRARVVFYPSGNWEVERCVLEELRPRFVVIYDPSVAMVRRCEVYKAQHPERQLRVYFLLYKGSVEEQRYLADLHKEKEAFEAIISEKAHLVITADKKSSSSAAGSRSPTAANDRIVGYNLSTGEALRAGKRTIASRLVTPAQASQRGKGIIVDMREFRSALPSILHRDGFSVTPATLEVGDYVLSPEIAIERKSIPDLFGSFNSGRLYKQAEALIRYYKRPALLIEFDPEKPFSLQAVSALSDEIRIGSIMAKLVLLTLHFPKLRLLWSPNLKATVELFRLLKANQSPPDVDTAMKVGAGEADTRGMGLSSEGLTPVEVLRRLPGVTAHNLPKIKRKFKSLKQLFRLDETEMKETMGAANGEKLYEFVHRVHVD